MFIIDQLDFTDRMLIMWNCLALLISCLAYLGTLNTGMFIETGLMSGGIILVGFFRFIYETWSAFFGKTA